MTVTRTARERRGDGSGPGPRESAEAVASNLQRAEEAAVTRSGERIAVSVVTDCIHSLKTRKLLLSRSSCLII